MYEGSGPDVVVDDVEVARRERSAERVSAASRHGKLKGGFVGALSSGACGTGCGAGWTKCGLACMNVRRAEGGILQIAGIRAYKGRRAGRMLCCRGMLLDVGVAEDE